VINSLKILAFFVLGAFLGYNSLLPDFFLKNDFSMPVLYLLMFLVGFGVGSNKKAFDILKMFNIKFLLIPLAIVTGSGLGGFIMGIFISEVSAKDSMAISFGFGYYSLSSVIISKIKGETLGVIALLSNISREIFTLVFTPILVKIFGKFAGIASGGATAMDTTLPVIKKYSGEDMVIVAFFSGIILSILVPFLVTFMITI